jgi:AcrR family transcriptional regulator
MLRPCQGLGTLARMAADDRPAARMPQQARSRRTVRRLLRAADELVPESGVVDFSMISLAERAGVNRATAYSYFPTKYAVFNALAERYLDDFLDLVRTNIEPADRETWTAPLHELIDYTAELYEREPTARILFLSAAATAEIDDAHHTTNNRRMASLMRELLEATGFVELNHEPDPYLLVVEAVIAVLATSERTAGHITVDYVDHARLLATAYLRSVAAER